MMIFRLLFLALASMALVTCRPNIGVETAVPEATSAAEGPADTVSAAEGAEAQGETAAESGCAQEVPGTHALLDAALGICFLYPDTFDVFQGEDGSLTLYERSLLNTEAPLATLHTEAANGRSLGEVTAQRVADYAFPGTEPQSVMLGGQPAAMLDNLPGQDTNRRLVTVHEDRVYDLMVARIGSDYGAVGDEAAALYDMLLKSFQWMASSP